MVSEKKGKTMYFRRAENSPSLNTDILDFFSEVSPCGVIGSYLLDKEGVHDEHFAFKHHYITGALDSEIICSLLEAINKESYVTIEVINRRKERISESDIVPLKIFVSVQSGRQYLMAYSPRFGRINPFRTDNIISVIIFHGKNKKSQIINISNYKNYKKKNPFENYNFYKRSNYIKSLFSA